MTAPVKAENEDAPPPDPWAGVRAALKAGDMPAAVALLHPLAVSDPSGVELFMALIAARLSERPSA